MHSNILQLNARKVYGIHRVKVENASADEPRYEHCPVVWNLVDLIDLIAPILYQQEGTEVRGKKCTG